MASSDASVSPSTAKHNAPDGPGLVGAAIVSYGVNPLVWPPLVFGLALAHRGASGASLTQGVGLGLTFFALVPLVHVGWMRARGQIESLEIRERSKRTEPFLVVLGAGVVAFLLALGLDVTGKRLLIALIGCHVLNTTLLFLITAWWKISVHCASVAGAVATLFVVRFHGTPPPVSSSLLNDWILGSGALLMPVMVWARIRSRAHTPAQAMAGTGLGFAAPYVELLALAEWIGL